MLQLPQTVDQSFQYRLKSFVSSLPVTDQDKLACEIEIVRLVLQIQDGAGSAVIRKSTFALGVLEEFTHFKNHYLDFSQYLNRVLWIVTPQLVRGGERHENAIVASDVDYCLSVISHSDNNTRVKDMAKLTAKQVNPAFNVDFMNIDEKWTTGAKVRRDLVSYVRSKVKNSLKFLWEYDPCFEQEDFIQDLVVEVLRVFNTYPKSKGKKAGLDNNSEGEIRNRVEMYIEMAVNNKVLNLKEYYTCDNRQRVANSQSALYKEKKKIKKAITKLKKDCLDSMAKAFGQRNHKLFANACTTFISLSPELVVQADAELVAEEFLDAADEAVIMEVATEPEPIGRLLSQNHKTHRIVKAILSKAGEEFMTKISLKEEQVKTLEREEKELEATIKVTDSDYYSTVSSMMRREDDSSEETEHVFDGEEVGFNTGPTSPYSPAPVENTAWVNGMVEKLRLDGEVKVARFVEIVTSEYDDEFDKWAESAGINTAMMPLKVKGAKKFLGLSDKELKSSELIDWLSNSQIVMSSDNEELFSKKWNLELAQALADFGMDVAFIVEDRKEPTRLYGPTMQPHAIALDGDKAVDIFGRKSVSAKLHESNLGWSKCRIMKGKEALDLLYIMRLDMFKFDMDGYRKAVELIETHHKYFFGPTKTKPARKLG